MAIYKKMASFFGKKHHTSFVFLTLFILCLFLIVVLFVPKTPIGNQQESYQKAYYHSVEWQALPQFENGHLGSVRQALLRSCTAFMAKPADTPLFTTPNKVREISGTVKDWWPFCTALQERQKHIDVSEVSLYTLLKKYLKPYALKEQNQTLSLFGLGKVLPNTKGLFTGYYEPVVRGNLLKTPKFQTPLYNIPEDVIVADLGDFNPELSGKRLVGRLQGNRLVPYYERAEIENGALKTHMPFLWLENPIDKFFLQIQGSGRVVLPDGQFIFVGYGGANGHAYTAIGRYMAEQGYLPLEDVTMQSIRTWLEQNPDKLTEVLHKNKSYVFFKEYQDGPYGTQGVLLTPEHSLAVDARVVPLGTPVFLQSKITATGENFEKLMVAQDTGGAIKGAIRGDIYFGYGKQAAELAGQQKSQGKLFILMPKEISVTNNDITQEN